VILSIFSYIICWHFYVFFLEDIFSNLSFFNQTIILILLLTYRSSLHIEDFDTVLDMCFTNIFPTLQDTILFCGLSPLLCWSLLVWCPTYLFLFLSTVHMVSSKRNVLISISWRFLPLCSSSFTVSDLMFNSLIYFELFSCMVWGKSPASFFCMWISRFPNTVCSRDHHHCVFLTLW
jgi:hypothetical protein